MAKRHTVQIIDYLLQQNKNGKAELDAYHNLVNELDGYNQNSGYQLFASEDEQKGEMSTRIVVHTEYGPLIKTITRTPQVKEMTAGVVKLTYEGFVPDGYYMADLAPMGMNHTRYIKVTASYGELVDYGDNGVKKASSDLLARIRVIDGKYRGGKWQFEIHDSTDSCYNDFIGKNKFRCDELFDRDTIRDYAEGVGMFYFTSDIDASRILFRKECIGPFWDMQHYFNREAHREHVPYALIQDNSVRKPDLQNYVQEHEMKD